MDGCLYRSGEANVTFQMLLRDAGSLHIRPGATSHHHQEYQLQRCSACGEQLVHVLCCKICHIKILFSLKLANNQSATPECIDFHQNKCFSHLHFKH